MEIKADVYSISKLNDFFFIVPDYQREYVWEPDDEVEQFLIDIENEFDQNTEMQKSYFIGSIIIVENNKRYDVIDGQQRLTTIMLSLCAIRDLISNIELDKKQEEYLKTINELLSNFDIETDKTQLRLELQYEDSRDFLNKLIDKSEYTGDLTSSIDKMQKAYMKIKDSLSDLINGDMDILTKYIKYYLTKIELVVIQSENLSSALKIFETINQRGVGLNAMDLVKNLIFSKANESDFGNIKEIWKEIQQNLKDCKEDDSPLRFLRYFLMARYHDGIIREDEIYKWIISDDGKNKIQYEYQPLRFANELKVLSKRYSDLVNATERMRDGGDFPKTTNIGFINKYKSRQHLILLLALDESADKSAIEYLAEQIESFFFYSVSLRIQAKNNERLFANWAMKLRNNKSKLEIAPVVDFTILPYLKEKINDFRKVFETIDHKLYHPLYRLKFILGRIENNILEKIQAPLNGLEFYNSMEIEHIAPQKPKDNILPGEFVDIEDYWKYIYRLGNASLLESQINKAVNKFNDLNSDWFGKKLEEYSKSNILSLRFLDPDFRIGKNTITNKLIDQLCISSSKWSKNEIMKRQDALLEFAFDTWRLNNKRIDK